MNTQTPCVFPTFDSEGNVVARCGKTSEFVVACKNGCCAHWYCSEHWAVKQAKWEEAKKRIEADGHTYGGYSAQCKHGDALDRWFAELGAQRWMNDAISYLDPDRNDARP